MAPAAAASTPTPAAAPAPAPAPSKPAQVAPASTGGATGPSIIAVLLLLIGGGAIIAGLLGFGAQMFSTITSGILLGVGFLVTLVAGFKKLFGG